MTFDLTIKDFNLEEKKIEAKILWVDPEFKPEFKEEEKSNNSSKKPDNKNILRKYSTKINVNELEVPLLFYPDEIKNLDDFINIINEKLEWILLHISEIKNHIAEKLLKLKNDSWLDENEKEVTKDEFIRRLNKIESIIFNDDTSFDIYFNDDDIFWGHGITLTVSKKLKLEAPKMIG